MIFLISGIILTIISWTVAWTKFSVISEHTFFPLWLGYILTINGFSQILLGKSLIKQMRFSFILLFLISIPMWWYFEFFNIFLQNWHYILPRPISGWEYFLRASLAFSTVVPAVLSTSFLFKNIIEKFYDLRFKARKVSKSFLFFLILLGISFLILIPIFPTFLFPLVWISAFLIIDPLNFLLGLKSFLKDFTVGKGIGIFSVMIATLFTGFWWEMWNFYSMPKWFYTIPYVGFFKIFEMPILGYLGYPVFGLEVLSYTILILSILKTIYKKTILPEL